jgi:competence protein ComEC
VDDIKTKLDTIDARMRPISTYASLIAAAPLLSPAVAFIAGIIAARAFDIPLPLSLSLALSSAAGAIALLFLTPSRNITYAAAALASLAFLSLGAARYTCFTTPRPNDIRAAVSHRTLATLKGKVLTAPRQTANDGWAFARFTYGDPGSTFYLAVTSAEASNGRWAEARGTVFVHVAEPVLDLVPGDSILIHCWLDTCSPATNPGQFDFAKYMASRGVFLSASVQSRDALTLFQHGSSSPFSKLKTAVRAFTAAALLSDLPESDTGRGLIEAFLLGSRTNIDPASYRDFQRTGLAHFISLSGMHIGILIGAVWFAAGFTGLLKPGRAAICLIVITLFLMVVPHRPPTIRAAIICYIFCLSCLLRRCPNSINTLSLAAILTLLLNPADLFTAGWQLSFAAVLGILLLHPSLYEILSRPLSRILAPHDDNRQEPFLARLACRTVSRIIIALSVSLSAWFAVAGILLYHFHAVTPLSPLWTVLALPFFTLILILGLTKILLAFAFPTLAAALGLLVTALADFLLWLVSKMANITISEILIGSVPLLTILLFYAALFFARFIRLPRPIYKTAALSILICFFPIHLAIHKNSASRTDDLTITCLDVGHGLSILCRLPAGPRILFDAGSMYNKDIGTRIVAPYLRYLGQSTLDAVIISHNDIDHINGIPEVAQLCNIKNIYAPPQFLAAAQKGGTAKFLADLLLAQNLEISPLIDLLPLSTYADLRLLWPPPDSPPNTFSDNDASAVLLIEYAGKSILLCADIEKLAQNRFVAAYSNLKPDVLIVPHHGSLNTLDPKFLESLDPEILICSCSQAALANKQTLAQFQEKQVLHTATHGAVSITVKPSGQLSISTMN